MICGSRPGSTFVSFRPEIQRHGQETGSCQYSAFDGGGGGAETHLGYDFAKGCLLHRN